MYFFSELEAAIKEASGVVQNLEKNIEQLRVTKAVAIANRENTEPAVARETEAAETAAKELIR